MPSKSIPLIEVWEVVILRMNVGRGFTRSVTVTVTGAGPSVTVVVVVGAGTVVMVGVTPIQEQVLE